MQLTTTSRKGDPLAGEWIWGWVGLGCYGKYCNTMARSWRLSKERRLKSRHCAPLGIPSDSY